jgi:hypothetical protein
VIQATVPSPYVPEHHTVTQLCVVFGTEQVNVWGKCFMLSNKYSSANTFTKRVIKNVAKSFLKNPKSTVPWTITIYRTVGKFNMAGWQVQCCS